MPILENAKKALRSSKRKATYNQTVRSRVKTTVDAAKKKPSMENLTVAYSAIDKAVKRNLFHQNKASRLKSQLAKLVKPTKLVKKTSTAAKKKTKTTPKKKTASKKPAKKAAKKTTKK